MNVYPFPFFKSDLLFPDKIGELILGTGGEGQALAL